VVAVAQPMVKIGDVDANIASHLEMITRAGKQGAKLVVSSEAGLTGYDKRGIGVKAAIAQNDARLNVFSKAAKKYGLCGVVGFFGYEGTKLFNTTVAFMPDGSRVVQHKAVLTEHELAAGIVEGPKARTPVVFEGRKIAMVICADVAIGRLWSTLEGQGFDTVALCTAGLGDSASAVPAADVFVARKRSAYVKKAGEVGFPSELLNLAIKHRLDFVVSNQAGFEPEKGFFHVGHGAVLSSDGRVHGVIPGQFIGKHVRAELLVAGI
jgi:predicted amidohydrolase